MQVDTINIPGGYMSENYWLGQPAGNYYQPNGASFRKAGTCAGIVQGDHKHPNNWTFNIWSGKDIEGITYYSNGGQWSKWDGTLPNFDNITSLLAKVNASDPYNKALSKLYDKIRSNVDLSIDIYQGRQTVQMIRDVSQALINPTRTLAKAAQSLIKSGKVRRGTETMANSWLAWQYGIKPSMATIHQLISPVVELTSNEDGFYVVSAMASSREDINLTIPRTQWSSMHPVNLTGIASRRSKIVLCYGISNAERNALSQFTSLNPVSFIYENIPFSFVLDWIVDVGGYLRNMETALMTGLEFKSGYITDTILKDLKATVSDTYTNGGTYTTTGSGWTKQVYLNRSILGAMPLPQLPSLDVSLGSQRLLSAASLLRGFLKH